MPSVVVHRSTLTEHPEIRFPVAFRKAQDIKYYEQLMKYYKVALIQEPLVKIRMRGDNSNSQVLVRFAFGAKAYNEFKTSREGVPPMALVTSWIYSVYHKFFGETRGKFKEFIANCFYTIPFCLSRVTAWYYGRFSNKDENYILRND